MTADPHDGIEGNYGRIQAAHCSLTKIAAIPIPEPIHMLVQNILLPVCFAMFNPVATWRAPATEMLSYTALEE